MKKYILILSTLFAFNTNAANDWLDCGTDANGDTANCQYKIDTDGTLTIRGVGNNGNIGVWDQDSGVIAPWREKGVTNVVIEESIKDLGAKGFNTIVSQNPIEIPSTITTITQKAFFGVNTSEIVIPDTVTLIKSDAFSWSGIQKIDIPDSVTTIEHSALRATSLTNLVVPDSVTFVGGYALSHIENLQTLTIGDNTQLDEIFTGWGSDAGVAYTSGFKIYCTGDTSKCDANLAAAGYSDLKSERATTKKINGVTYVYDSKGKLVTTSGHRTEKRIYTIEEANQVAGKVNRVSIKYR